MDGAIFTNKFSFDWRRIDAHTHTGAHNDRAHLNFPCIRDAFFCHFLLFVLLLFQCDDNNLPLSVRMSKPCRGKNIIAMAKIK